MYLDRVRKDYNGQVNQTQIGYWRKANQIYKEFCEINEDARECEYIDVTIEQLTAIKEKCEKVLKDHDLAKELLPPMQGFFFGSYNYDEWYFEQLEDTITIIKYIEL